jgi:hypothetical protein
LTDEGLPEDTGGGAALAQKFSDIATVFSRLEPRLARMMFGRLSRAVLDLEEAARRELLRRTILPALLDGKVEGTVLREFPDVELADALLLLLDLETAAPEVLAAALDRLDLEDERRTAIAPLLDERLRQGRSDGPLPAAAADQYARRLIDVKHAEGRSFAEFAAFDLAVDAQIVAQVDALVDALRNTDTAPTSLRCLRSLVRLEPNPGLAAGFLARAASLLDGLARAGRWADLGAWCAAQRDLAKSLRESRPDVAEVIDGALADFWTEPRAAQVLDLARDDAHRETAASVVAAAGPAIAAAMVTRLAVVPAAEWQVAVQLLCAHAPLFAPALVPALDNAPPAAARAIIRVLGHAGPSYARRVGDQLSSPDEHVAREALRALARIGSAQAAACVSARVRESSGWLAAAAEETLWHFPAAETRRQVRDLLDRQEFVMRQPATACRLIDRLMSTGATGLESTLTTIAALRFRVWNPALARVGRKAHALAGGGA